MFSTDFIFRQQDNLVDNQKCQAGFRPLCNKMLQSYDRKRKYFHFRFCKKNLICRFFCDICNFCVFFFCVITFEPNNIQTSSAPQNDRLNLSVLKNIMQLLCEKMARNGRKMDIFQLQILVISLQFSLHIFKNKFFASSILFF